MGARLLHNLAIGACLGALGGVLDGLLAWADVAWRWEHGPLATLGAVAAAALLQATLLAAVALLLGLLGARPRRTLILLVTALLFLELYWRTRVWLFPGRSALSPERLVVAGGLMLLAAVVAWFMGQIVRAPRQPWPRRCAGALLVLFLFGGWVLTGEGSRGAQRGRISPANQDQPNIVLVIVDALRADHLGCYGGTRVRTPQLDRLATSGVLFEQARVQAPTTWPSFGSILTGKYPLRHGLLSMRPGVALPDSVTLASHLKRARRGDGIRLEASDRASAAFMTGALTNGSRLLQGFDQTSEMLDGNDLVDLASPWSQLRAELPLFRALNKLRQRVDGELVLTTALDWIERHRDRRFLALVHLYSTHTPYDPPRRFREPYLDPGYEGPLDAFYPHHRQAIEAGAFDPDAADVARIRDLYAACVAEVDGQIGRLVGELERLGLRDETLIVVTADHGEELGEHGLWEHNWMYETNLRVPLLLSWPGRLPAGVRVADPVETVDLLPTVCALLDLELPEAQDAYGLIDGESLVPLVEGVAADPGEPAFAVNTTFAAVVSGGWKLILPLEDVERGVLDRGRLFHLAQDPGETRELLAGSTAAARERAGDLARLLHRWTESQPVPRSLLRRSSRDLDDLEILRSLGYVDD